MRETASWRLAVALVLFGVGPIGFGLVLDRPSPLAFGLAYPAFLAWFAGGLALAGRSRASWWVWMSVPIPLVPIMAFWLVAMRSPESLQGAIWLIRTGYVLILAWLAAGGGVAAFGWWTWARGAASAGEASGSKGA